MRYARALVSILLLAACGGSTSSVGSSASNDDGGMTGSDGGTSGDSGPRGDGGCVLPVVGEVCTPGEVACDDGQNACCRGYVWNCDGHWQKLGLGCACQVAQPFACGDKTCSPGQYCQDTNVPNHTGDGGSTQSYQCLDMPTACSATPTCECLSQHVGCGCTETNGHLQTLCLAP